MNLHTTVLLLALHSVNGTEIDINAAEITSMREAREDDSSDKLVTKGVRCVIMLTDGKFASVTETCAAVRDELQARVDQAVRRLRDIMQEDDKP